jgi:ABC-type Zn2+ transport system substrate-binding protein/surface adhesin
MELSKLEGADALPYTNENPWLTKMKQLPTAAVKHTNTHTPKPINVEKPKPGEATAKPDEVLIDPHLWLDPERMAAIALPLASEIAGKVPHARHELMANARYLSTHLRRDVIPAMRDLLSKPSSTISAVNRPEIPFITYHAAYQYFMGRFKLAHYGEITSRPELKMGASSTATMLSGAESLHIHCLIGEEKDVLMTRIAKSSGARIVLLSPEQIPERKNVDALGWIENDYDRLLYVTAKAFSGCLQR